MPRTSACLPATALLLACILAAPRPAAAQTPTPVPTLDLNRLMGVWYEQARLPVKREKSCVSDAMVLYALGDKKGTFQVVTSCQTKGDNSDAWNDKGKSSKTGDGGLKLSRLVILSSKYWVLATGEDYDWVLIGSPNHKTLWLLSRTSALSAPALSAAQSKAAAMGFDNAKLIHVAQHK